MRDVQEDTRPHVGSTDGRSAARQIRSRPPLYQRRHRRVWTMGGADKEDNRKSSKLKLCMASRAIHIERQWIPVHFCVPWGASSPYQDLLCAWDVIDAPTLLVRRPRSTTKRIRSQWQITYRNKDVVVIQTTPCIPLRRSFGGTERHPPLHLRCHAVGVKGAAADPRAPCHLNIRNCDNSQCPPDHSLTVEYRPTTKRKPPRLPHKLWKRQSLTTVLLRTPITQMTFFNQGVLLLGSNHFLTYQSIFRSDLSSVLLQNFRTSFNIHLKFIRTWSTLNTSEEIRGL